MNNYYPTWDLSIKAALDQAQKVPQPLWDMMDIDTRTGLLEYLSGKSEYTSSNSLKWQVPVNIISTLRSSRKHNVILISDDEYQSNSEY